MTDPGAFVLIGSEYDVGVARALAITATSACLIAATLRKLVTLLLSDGAGPSLDFGPDGYQVVASLEDGWGACDLRGARFPSPLLLGLNQGVRVRVWFLERLGDPPPWLVTLSNPNLACFPTARSECCVQGHAGTVSSGLWGSAP